MGSRQLRRRLRGGRKLDHRVQLRRLLHGAAQASHRVALAGEVQVVGEGEYPHAIAATQPHRHALAFHALSQLGGESVAGLPEALVRINGELAGLVLFLGILGGALGYFLWTFALSRLTPTQVAVYVNFNPMVATILAAALLAERLTGVFGVGFVAVLGGVLLVNLPRTVRQDPSSQAD